jgi:hypothetical protein
MTKLLLVSLLAASAAGLAARPAYAGGDVAAHLREMNAICELQRRGEAPPHPNLCLPEYPPDAVSEPPRRGR